MAIYLSTPIQLPLPSLNNPMPVAWISRWLNFCGLCLLLLLLTGWMGAPAAWAQESQIPPPTVSEPLMRPTLDSNSIPSEKVNQFVQAYLDVLTLIERREGDLQGAETESESQRIEQEIEAEALARIEAAGLTRHEYLQLLGLANTDGEFGERIVLQLQESSP